MATEQTLKALCADIEVSISHPLEDPGFLAAVASALPRTGYRTRDQAMTALFGHLLPTTLLQRHTKAAFNDAFFNAHSRAFAENWDGTGLDPTLVDAERLRETWLAEHVDARSLSRDTACVGPKSNFAAPSPRRSRRNLSSSTSPGETRNR